jgi:L-ribulose-5-phosphate 4-epimerase
MYDSHLVQATQGNLSARDPESGFICVMPSGTDYQLLMTEDIVVIDENGKVVEGKRRPTVETPVQEVSKLHNFWNNNTSRRIQSFNHRSF